MQEDGDDGDDMKVVHDDYICTCGSDYSNGGEMRSFASLCDFVVVYHANEMFLPLPFSLLLSLERHRVAVGLIKWLFMSYSLMRICACPN